ncbi:SDR family oxidoreductase [Mycobacterium terramassiliense]|uniref:NAD(P)-dependent dehydrogenase, short-chain alcohol dehydrogenase family n=1 Tax=Mycobacterium terramassiliense TaxID=1841859 RepID=A0A2U3N7K6_9MYCO|nr:SDR family oxidoreductase [Mycobacterium terramassiliense]SPM27507.1 NAD(P)-dependent dehydrogenase, short-chain alcohol dehydrogenase family [Mycobacterium terramassiliense]
MSFAAQQQEVPGVQGKMNPVPDCGENGYRGSGKLTGKRAIITGGDSGIGRNVGAYFHLAKAAVPHMKPGSSIIGSSSVNSDSPNPTLAPYAATKAAIANFSASLAQLLGDKGIRVNSVAPGPIWTPLIPSTMPPESVESFGDNVPLGRAGQPAELAPICVVLASDDASYISGARVAVTGGRPIL